MEKVIKKETILDKCFKQDFPNERPDNYMENIYKKGFEAGLNKMQDYLKEQNMIPHTSKDRYSWDSMYTVFMRKLDELKSA